MSAEKRFRTIKKIVVYKFYSTLEIKIPLINLGELLRKMEWGSLTPQRHYMR
jgi:hypothetical protein